MTRFTEQEVIGLLGVAAANDGHCDRCKRVLKIYKYGANAGMATLLRSMAKAQYSTGQHEINLTTLGLPYKYASQQSKTRLHGLIVQIKNEDGTRKLSTWRITSKGFKWLRGEAIPEKVIVFDNQVIGHEGREVTINEISPDADYQDEAITTPEAAVYHDVRPPVEKQKTLTAKYKRRTYSMSAINFGAIYEIVVDKLQMGKPVNVTVVGLGFGGESTLNLPYMDIAAFQSDWQIIEERKSE